MRGRTVVWKETGKMFESLREAAAEFDVEYSCLYSGMRKYNGLFGIRPGVTLEWETYDKQEGEEFKPIPGYEGKYSISNLKNVRSEAGKRLLKPANLSNGRRTVILYSDSIPLNQSVEKLYEMTWLNNSSDPIKSHVSRTSKTVECTTDNIEFKSYIECCKYYHFDYQTFRKAVKLAVDGKFQFRDKEFKLTEDAE